MRGVVIRVPASTANLGPGFDCLGLALGLYNEVNAQVVERGLRLQIEGEGAEALPCDRSNLFFRAVAFGFQRIQAALPGLSIRMVNCIPPRSGLGSSAATVVAGLAAANALNGEPFDKPQLLGLAWELEGHADNAAASLFGGLNIVNPAGGDVLSGRVPVGPLRVIVALPQIDLPTSDMRKALPETVPFADVIYNVANAALSVQALRDQDYGMLARCMKDRLHQPYRKARIPGYDAVVDAARSRGAAAVALSGAGPSMVAFAPTRHKEIAAAMGDAFQAAGVAARTFVLPVDRSGVQVKLLEGE
jgi:homoserine kinase